MCWVPLELQFLNDLITFQCLNKSLSILGCFFFSVSAPLSLVWGCPQWFLPAQKGWLSCSCGSCWTITDYSLLYWSMWKLVSILVHGAVTMVVQQLPPKQLSQPCSKGEKWKIRRERLQQPLGEAHLTPRWTLGSYTALAPISQLYRG